jgi:hypothetical protein
MTKLFTIPFALAGNKTAVPDAVQPDGSISYTEGWGSDYELANTDPSYKPISREQTNQMFNDVTSAIAEVQYNGVSLWSVDGSGNYPIYAIVRHNDLVWMSTAAMNATEPGAVGTTWNDITDIVNLDKYARLDILQSWTKPQLMTPGVLTYAASIAWDFSLYAAAEMTLTGDATLANPTNIQASKRGQYSLLVKQDGTGGWNLAFGSAYVPTATGGNLPSIATEPNAITLLVFETDGTLVYCGGGS